MLSWRLSGQHSVLGRRLQLRVLLASQAAGIAQQRGPPAPPCGCLSRPALLALQQPMHQAFSQNLLMLVHVKPAITIFIRFHTLCPNEMPLGTTAGKRKCSGKLSSQMRMQGIRGKGAYLIVGGPLGRWAVQVVPRAIVAAALAPRSWAVAAAFAAAPAHSHHVILWRHQPLHAMSPASSMVSEGPRSCTHACLDHNPSRKLRCRIPGVDLIYL